MKKQVMNPLYTKVFIAEDNPMYRHNLEVAMETRFNEVKSFETGEEMMKSLQENPTVILLDHQFLSGKNGLELLPQIMQHNSEIKVVFLSGQKMVDIAVESLKKGAVDYIEKGKDDMIQLEKVLERLGEEHEERLFSQSSSANDSLVIPNLWLVIRRLHLFNQAIPPSMNSLLLVMGFALVFAQACSFPIEAQTGRQFENDMDVLLRHQDHGIQIDDKLSISIWNNEDLSVGSVFGIYNSNEVYGKWILVDPEGKVDLPKIGKVKLQGFTCEAAAEHLRQIYSKEIVDPVIVVKVLNKEITLLGEVKDPGTYTLDKEKNNLMEVLGKAGGFTDYARTKKIKLVREVDGYKKEFELNLDKLSPRLASNINVNPGDVIVVPTGKGKKWEKKLPLLIPLASLLTGVAILISVFPRNN